MKSAVVLFTRDLRLHDNPTLRAALDASETVLPLFVLDDGIARTRYGAAANRRAFLTESLVDLDTSLRRAGAALDVRRGDVVAETVKAVRRVGAEAVFVSADVSPYARERERRLGAQVDLRVVDASFVVPAGEVAPSGGTHYQVFTPYYRAWLPAWRGEPHGTPRAIRLPEGATAKPLAAAAPGVPRWRRRVGRGGVRTAVAPRRPRGLRGGARRGRRRRDLAALAVPPLRVRLRPGAGDARTRAGRCGVRTPALLAGLLRTAPVGPARDRPGRPPPAGRSLGRRRTAARGLEGGPHRLPARGRRHAAAARGGVDAQSRAARRRLVPRQGSRHRLARGRAPLLRPPARRRRRPERRQLAVGGGNRRRHAAQPRLQPHRSAEARRPGRRVREALRPGARGRAPSDLSEPGLLAPDYPAQVVDHAEAVAAFRKRRGA